MKKILLFITTFLIFACSTDSESNPCIYEPTLETNAVTDITETSATLNGVISIVSENCDVANNTEQGFVYSTEIQPTLEDTQVNVNGTNISTNIEGLTPNTTYYVRAFLTNNLGDFYGDEVSFSTTDIPCDVVYLDENGVTIKACPDANVGDTGTVNGDEYVVVDESLLLQWYYQDLDEVGDTFFANNNIKPCVSRITSFPAYDNTNWSLNEVFYYGENIGFDLPSDYEQVIMSFDVSNVTIFNRCFSNNTEFNIDIGYWDVSSAIDMFGMFFQAHSFNQDISNWDVSNVESMQGMFAYAGSFNQPIGDWDVSNVKDMAGMFGSSYEGNEDVNPPTIFNQDISNWDVSSVTSMTGMFDGNIEFNQDISNWDVSNTTYMWRMFKNASSFNQALGNWSVGNVTSCSSFSQGASSWTLPQPNFTNCNPN